MTSLMFKGAQNFVVEMRAHACDKKTLRCLGLRNYGGEGGGMVVCKSRSFHNDVYWSQCIVMT